MHQIKAAYELQSSYGFWIHQLRSAMRVRMERRLKEHGVTLSQWTVLAVLKQGEATRAAEIKNWLDIDSTAVTRLLDRLEQKGLVSRSRVESDRRAHALALTDQAQSLLPKLEECATAVNDQFVEGLSAEERAQFLDLVKRMLRNKEEQT